MPPFARDPHLHHWHGETYADPYHWLRADNWQDVAEDPSVLSADIATFLTEQNTRCAHALSSTEALQETLLAEMRGRVLEDDESVPVVDGSWQYYTRTVKDAQYRVYCRAPRGGGDEHVLLDGNRLAEGESYLSLAAVSHSPDHQWLAVAQDVTGSERYVLTVQSLESGEKTALTITGISGDVQWSADSAQLYYTQLDDNHRPDSVWRVSIHGGEPVCVYRESDPGFFVGVGDTRSGRFIVIHTHDHVTDEQWVIDGEDPHAKPRCLATRVAGRHYEAEHWGESWLIRTNQQGAVDFKLQHAPLGCTDASEWQDWYVPAPGVLLEDYLLFADHLVVEEQHNALPRLGVTPMSVPARAPSYTYIAFDEACYVLGALAGYEFETTEFRFHYESPATPGEQWRYDLASHERALLKRQQVPSGHDSSDYRTLRCEAIAPDGVRVPVSLLYHRDTALDGSAPCLLTGYGAYGMSSDAYFSISRLSLVDRGFVYGIAHVRGGMEKGYQWYLDGKTDKKTNTFDDFVAAADHLVNAHWVNPDKLACYGGSAGGMLIGAVLNQRPALFAAAVADVPFVDVLATMMDSSLPLTPPEWPEWGNPVEDVDAFQRIASYSPIDNVQAVSYPHLLVLAGLSDPRVTYWEPAKWVAKLHDVAVGDNMLLLRTNMEAGHGGASGRFDALRETALVYAFLLEALDRG